MNLESLFEQVNPKLFPEPTIRTLSLLYQFLQLGGYFYQVNPLDHQIFFCEYLVDICRRGV